MLEWNGRLLPLAEGENIVGRSPAHCSVCIDDPRVSKRHARIVVSGNTAVVEDLKSTNHTFVRGVQIGAAHGVADGDIIRFGGPDVTFRRSDVPTVRVRNPAAR
jgi:pSer/pThr/pTyr-binding forkhead associated (FHA) protein